MLLCLIFSATTNSEPLAYYFPDKPDYQSEIPTPQSILGFNVGDRHVRHDQLIEYFRALSESSDNVQLEQIGLTNEHRKQVLATISSKENLDHLDDILTARQLNERLPKDAPAVVWLGYSIHGNEISGSNASMLVAYYLAAAQTPEIKSLLDDVIVIIEPSMNPDGMDLFSTWANSNRNQSLNTDPAHRTHIRQWPSGRTNHFHFDLNRDWLPLTQVESRNRVRNFHKYKPNVLADFHEMGKDSTYFFQPGVLDRTNPLTPEKNIELTKLFATYHAKALDSDNRLYYSQESFDDFYYGKGSTYPDINGTIGILFEQASSRGYAQDSINGVLTFGFGVKNHVLTSFSTLTAAQRNKDQLQQFKYDAVQENLRLADDEKFAGYLFTEAHDSYRLNEFLSLLSQHQINVYPLTKNHKMGKQSFDKDNSYFVPLKQAQYRVIKTIFSQVTEFKNNTFYDVSGWTIPLAYNIKTAELKSTRSVSVAKTLLKTVEASSVTAMPEKNNNAYAYAFTWDNYLAPKLLNKLVNNGILARVATKPFTQQVNGKTKRFKTGTIVIPAGIQQKTNWLEILTTHQQQTHIDVYPLMSGLTPEGVELGSSSLKPINPVNVLLVGGQGVNPNEAGHMINYIDGTLGIPVSIVEIERLRHISLTRYSHILFVDGNYHQIEQSTIEQLENWLTNGGTVYGQRRGAKWLANQGILKAEFVSQDELAEGFSTQDLSYDDKEKFFSQQRIAGTIFSTQIDTSHPLAYGYNNSFLPIFKNSTILMKQPKAPFVTVNSYTKNPLLSGYSATPMTNKVAEKAAIIAHNYGDGRVIASTENLTFRGYWLGTSKIIGNALFFSHSFSARAPTIKTED